MPDLPQTPSEPAASPPSAGDLLTSGAPSPSVTPEPHEAPSQRQQLSDAEIENLINFSNQAYERLQTLEPYQEKIERLVKDEQYRQFVESATTHYDQGQKQLDQSREAEIPAWAKPMVEFVESQKQTIAQRQQEDQNKFHSEQRVVADRLQRENSLTPAQIADLAYHADALATRYQRRVGLEEAYSHIRGFVTPTQHGAPPTVGLRGDASVPGVPGRSLNPEDFSKDFHSATLSLLRSNGKS